MPDKKEQVAKAVNKLVDQAAEVLSLAKGQRATADKQQAAADIQQEAADRQHVNARKLEVVGETMQVSAAALKDKLNEDTATKSPAAPESAVDAGVRH